MRFQSFVCERKNRVAEMGASEMGKLIIASPFHQLQLTPSKDSGEGVELGVAESGL